MNSLKSFKVPINKRRCALLGSVISAAIILVALATFGSKINFADIWQKNFTDTTSNSRTLLMYPVAKLYTGENLTGSEEVYNFNTSIINGGCKDLNNSHKIQSIDTEGTCVRLFSSPECNGWSQSMYPGSSSIIDPNLEGVHSIGPCVSNEFDYAILEGLPDSSVKVMQKNESQVQAYQNIPDIIAGITLKYGSSYPPGFHQISNNTYNPVQMYLTGHGGRLEGIRAHISARHLRSPWAAEARRRRGQKQSLCKDFGLNKDADEVGYAIPLELGGPADPVYNCFVQNKKQAANYRALIVSRIRDYLEENPDDDVRLEVTLLYESAGTETQRASGLWYRIQKGAEITYGYFHN